jgi:hypothetical protein
MITLRRAGPDADIDWETGRLLNRRSKGHGPEIRNVVKQKDNFGVPLPQDIVEILSWHVETQLDPRQLKNKEQLLFPVAKGADFRSMSSLAKPFAKVAEAIGVEFKFTQRGMRRTYNDLSRAEREARDPPIHLGPPHRADAGVVFDIPLAGEARRDRRGHRPRRGSQGRGRGPGRHRLRR